MAGIGISLDLLSAGYRQQLLQYSKPIFLSVLIKISFS